MEPKIEPDNNQKLLNDIALIVENKINENIKKNIKPTLNKIIKKDKDYKKLLETDYFKAAPSMNTRKKTTKKKKIELSLSKINDEKNSQELAKLLNNTFNQSVLPKLQLDESNNDSIISGTEDKLNRAIYDWESLKPSKKKNE